MSGTKRTLESIKSAAIVVLFLTTILLLYLSWGKSGVDLRNFIEGSGSEEDILSAESVIIPKYSVFSHGNGIYSVKDGSFADFKAAFKELAARDELLCEEVTEQAYGDATAENAVIYEFDIYLPFSEYCEILQISRIAGAENVGTVSALVFSESGGGSIFVKSEGAGEGAADFFRIAGGNAGESFSGLAETIDRQIAEAGEDEIYFTLGTYLGEEVYNELLLPLNLDTELGEAYCRAEIAADDREGKAEYAKDFFGDNFDFVRKIEEESGRVIYMYGYGKRTLSADTDGSFEYSQEDDGSENLRYSEALDRALRFVAEHGGFKTMGGYKPEPYLEKAEADPENRRGRGYRFSFSFTEGGKRVRYMNGSPITVELIGGKTVYFKRKLFEIEGFSEAAAEEAGTGEGLSALNMLAQSYEDIFIRAKALGLWPEQSEISFEDFASGLLSLDCAYVYMPESDGGGRLIPAWIAVVSDGAGEAEFYLPLYADEGEIGDAGTAAAIEAAGAMAAAGENVFLHGSGGA